jgi:hypothetical protein
MAVPDDFGRLRLLLLDERPDGAADGSWGRLRDAVPRPHAGYQAPYEVRAGALGPDADGVRGTVWIVLPAHRRAHWREVAEGLRGQWVTVEVTVRPFHFPSSGRELPGADAPDYQQGASFDLAMLAPTAAP